MGRKGERESGFEGGRGLPVKMPIPVARVMEIKFRESCIMRGKNGGVGWLLDQFCAEDIEKEINHKDI